MNYSNYNVQITMHDGTVFTVGYWNTNKASNATSAARLQYPGHKSYRAVKQ